VTDASKGPTEQWIAKYDAKYAYGYDTKRELSQFLGIRGIPNAVLVSPSGKIVWQGHPAGLKPEIIEPHLNGAISRPMWEWPKSASAVAKALKQRSYSKARTAAVTLAKKDVQFGPELVSSIDALIQGQVDSIQADYDAGRFLQVVEASRRSKKSLSGLPAAKTIREIVAKVNSDKTAKKTVAMQKRLRKLTAEQPRSRREAEKLIVSLRKLQKSAKGTVAATETAEFITSLEALLPRMR